MTSSLPPAPSWGISPGPRTPCRVKGAGPHVVASGTQHGGQAVLQLSGGLVGEGDGQDGPGDGALQTAQALLLRLTKIARIYVEYERRLKDANALDFDELEGENVLNGGPPEAVYGLVVVAHYADAPRTVLGYISRAKDAMRLGRDYLRQCEAHYADVLKAPRQGGGQLVLEVVGVRQHLPLRLCAHSPAGH